MSYRKLVIGDKTYEYTIGKKFVKIRHVAMPIPIEDCGRLVGDLTQPLDEFKYAVTPSSLKEYITSGKLRI